MNNKINIDFSEKYTFGQVLDMLNENSTLSFVSKGKLYFKRNNVLKTYDIKCNNKHENLIECNEVDNPMELLNLEFYKTDHYISNIITEISIDKVKKYLLDGEIIIFQVDENTWTISFEDDVVFLDYEQVIGATEDNYQSIFMDDLLCGLLYGQWFVIEGGEEDDE